MGVEHGWRWFALVLNTAPLPGITATAIFDFLEVGVAVAVGRGEVHAACPSVVSAFPQVAGHTLMNTYGVQFRKLLRVLVSHYLPK